MSDLSPEAKIAINDYLSTIVRNWAKWLGIANAFFLVSSGAYVFFVLPHKASSEATALLNTKLESELVKFDKLSEKHQKLSEEFGRILERSERLSQEAKKNDEDLRLIRASLNQGSIELEGIQAKLVSMQRSVEIAQNADPTKMAELVSAFNKNPDMAKLILEVKELRSEILNELPRIKERIFTERANIANGAVAIKAHGGFWGDWTKPVMAPANHYVAGIRVRMEGKQGDGDDTALNAVELLCLPFNP